MQKSLLRTVFLIIVLSSCGGPIYKISSKEFHEIPVGSSKVVVLVPVQADSLRSIISSIFARNACPVISDPSGQVRCDGKSVEGGTLMKVLAFIEPETNGSKATLTALYGLDAQGQAMYQGITGHSNYSTAPAIFQWDARKRSDVAFQYMVLMAREIPSANISYQK